MPMTRVQIARDVSMAETLQTAAVPDKTVLLLAGRSHVDRDLGIARHLPRSFNVKTVGIGAEPAPGAPVSSAQFDAIWPAAPGPEIDHCEQFKAQRMGAQPS